LKNCINGLYKASKKKSNGSKPKEIIALDDGNFAQLLKISFHDMRGQWRSSNAVTAFSS